MFDGWPRGLPYARRPLWHAFPALCPARAASVRVLLGLRPSLHRLRRRSPGLVRRLHCYYGGVCLLMPVHHRLRFLTFPMRTSRLCSLWPDMRPLRFRRAPFGRDVAFDPGGATASRIAMPHMLPSTVPSVSASAKFFLSWLNPTPHPITVYASHPPSPTTAQHSLPGGALPPYRGRSFTGRNASASPDAPVPEVRIHLPPAASPVRTRVFGANPIDGQRMISRTPLIGATAPYRLTLAPAASRRSGAEVEIIGELDAGLRLACANARTETAAQPHFLAQGPYRCSVKWGFLQYHFQMRRIRALPVALPMLLFFALFVTIFVCVSKWEHVESLVEFRLLSHEIVDKIRTGLEEQEVFLEQLERSFSVPITPSAADFHHLVEKLLRRFPLIQAVEWAPLISSAQRGSFEAAQQTDMPGFEMREVDPEGYPRRAGERAQYYPVAYIEPLRGNEEAVGFDLASDPDRKAALGAALRNGGIVATAPIRLIQETAGQPGILLIFPVLGGAANAGVLLVVHRMGIFLQGLLEPFAF